MACYCLVFFSFLFLTFLPCFIFRRSWRTACTSSPHVPRASAGATSASRSNRAGSHHHARAGSGRPSTNTFHLRPQRIVRARTSYAEPDRGGSRSYVPLRFLPGKLRGRPLPAHRHEASAGNNRLGRLQLSPVKTTTATMNSSSLFALLLLLLELLSICRSRLHVRRELSSPGCRCSSDGRMALCAGARLTQPPSLTDSQASTLEVPGLQRNNLASIDGRLLLRRFPKLRALDVRDQAGSSCIALTTPLSRQVTVTGRPHYTH